MVVTRKDKGNATRFGRLGPAMLALAGMCVATQSVTAQDRIENWSISGTGNNVVVADCEECGDDIGMMIACQGRARPAEVTIHHAAVENGTDGKVLPVTVVVDQRRFTYQAVTVEYGQIGFTPVFALSANDPLIEALQAGRRARITFSGQNTDISLKGSRKAFKDFNAQCRWNEAAAPNETQPFTGNSAPGAASPLVTLSNRQDVHIDIYAVDANGQAEYLSAIAPGETTTLPFQPQLKLEFDRAGTLVASYVVSADANQTFEIGSSASTVSPPPAAVSSPTSPAPEQIAQGPSPQGEGLVWQYFDDGQGAGVLIYGVPETDNAILAATCRAGTGTAQTEFFAGPSAGAAGQAVAFNVTSQSGVKSIDAKANAEGRPVSTGGPRGGLWVALLEPGIIAFSANGKSFGQVGSISRSVEAGQFFSNCGWQ